MTGITLGSALLDGSTPSTTITVNFSEKVTDFIGTDLVLPAGVTLSNGVLAANGLSFTATLTAGANIADETQAIAVTGGSYHDANGNAGAAFTGPSLEVNTQGPSVTGITLGSALLDGSTPSTTITVNFSEKVTDFIGIDLVLPAGVTLSNGVLAANGLSFTATLTAGANIADETQAIAVTGGSYHDANGNAGAAFTGPSLEVNTLPVLTVGVSVVGNLPVQEGQTLVATATISNDPADAGATINYQWQSSSDGGLTWINVGGALSGGFSGALSSFLQLTEGNEGQQFRVQSSFTDSGGQLITATSSPTVAVADVTPVITAPFSQSAIAVDDLSIVKNGTQIYDDTFSQAPPSSPTILSNGVPSPIVYLTLGSTWTESNGHAVLWSPTLQSTGFAPSTAGTGNVDVVAVLNTNTDPTSTLGLKEGAAFTVSSTFDLTALPRGSYGMQLNDGTSTQGQDQVVELLVQGLSNGNTVVELVQANFTTSPVTTAVLASQTLTAAQLANNNQIEFQLSHAANSTAITGTFELLSGGNITSTTTFVPTGTIFTNGVDWTRVVIGAFTSPAVALNVAAGQSPLEGQTLSATASTNDGDATINYQWQESSSSSFTTVTNIGTNSATYVVQPSDVGSFIRVVATTSDPHNAQSATATSLVTGAALPVAPTLTIANHTLSVNEDGTIALGISETPFNQNDPVSITIAGIPSDATLTDANNDALAITNGSITLTSAQLAGLTFNAGEVTQATLQVTATNTAGATAASAPQTITLTVNPAPEAPSLAGTVLTASGVEGTAIPLTITATPVDGDDVLSISVTGVPLDATLSAGTNNGGGNWTLTAAQLVGLKLNAGETSGTLHVTATNTTTGEVASSAPSDIAVTVNPGPEAPSLAGTVLTASGVEGTAIPLTITATPVDGDDVLSISVSGVPLDATLSAGTNNGGGNWTLTAAQLVGLKLNAGETAATLHVTATNTTTGEVASSAPSDIAVTVNPGPEAPSLAGTALTASGVEGTAIPLTITATPVDGDDVLSISVSGVPLDATLSAGTNNGGGNWTLTAAQLSGLKLNAGETAATLHVTATNTTTGEVASSATSDIAVTVNPLAENPVLGEASASVTVSEGSQGNALGLTLAPVDSDDVLSVSISGVPSDATLSMLARSTTATADWTLSAAQLAALGGLGNLTLNAGETSGTLTITATNAEGGSAQETLALTVNPAPEAPSLTGTVLTASGVEGTAIPLTITATPVDGDDVLSISVSGVPLDATLSAGTNNGGGNWTLTAPQLVGLKLNAGVTSGTLHVTATNTTTGEVASTTNDIVVTVTSSDVDTSPETPSLAGTVLTASGVEGTAIPLTITATPVDGDDVLSISVSGVPLDATLSAGTNNGGGSWTLTAAQLSGLKLNAGETAATLHVTATNTTTGEVASSATSDIAVTVNPGPEAPSLAGTVLTASGARARRSADDHGDAG